MRTIWPRSRPAKQWLLPFQERRQRLEKIFRRSIVAATIVGVVGIWLAMAHGRAAVSEKLREAKWSALREIGLEPDRAEVDAYWADRRSRREVRTRAAYRKGFAALAEGQRAMLRAGGMGPDDAIVRWGNYDMTLVFPSTVFERDDDGRYYRFRPNTRAIFFRQMNFLGLDTCMFYMPDTPEIRRLAAESGSTISTIGAQSTNSWGCRGPEPDLNAPVRGLALGDSFMQGYPLADDETPPMCLQRTLQSRLGVSTSILNTGVLGYSPEHYFHTLRAFVDRFRPQFVVVGIYVNDFGLESAVLQGEGDWAEGAYWLEKITDYCRTRNILCFIAIFPSELQIVGYGRHGDYPGPVSNIARVTSEFYCDPTDEFVTEDVRLNLEERRKGKQTMSLLYSGHLHDGHLSARGAELWSQIVGRRVAIVLENRNKVAKVKPAGH